MRTTKPGPDRWRLGFRDEVLARFGFLTERYGSHAVRADPTHVRYESRDIFVNVFHGRASYELGVEIGPLGPGWEPGWMFSLRELLSVVDPEAAARYRPFQVTTPEGMKRFVPTLAGIVRQAGDRALRGDEEIFKQLKNLVTERSKDQAKEQRLRPVRAEAETAWRRKDYRAVISLYERVENDLSPLEARRLRYARKRLLQEPISPN
jgi:hypothetical protein